MLKKDMAVYINQLEGFILGATGYYGHGSEPKTLMYSWVEDTNLSGFDPEGVIAALHERKEE